MNSVGFYGKLAGRGDFVSRGLPNTFVEPWDAWLASGMRASQDELGAAWLDAYLTSPLWRFAIAPGLLGGEAVTGVVMPSIDRVGRYFPLTVACLLPANADLGGLVGGDDGWFEQVESLLLSTLEPEAEVEAFEQAVAQLPAPPCGPRIEQSLISGNLLRSEAVTPAQRLAALAQHACDGASHWWGRGSARISAGLMRYQGLPPAPAFGRFLVSSLIVDTLRRIPAASSLPAYVGALRTGLAQVNERVRQEAGLRGVSVMGSTLVLLAARGNQASCLWAGDSRLYRLRGGVLEAISRDHSYVQELLDNALISEEEARHHPRANVVTRAVGVHEQLELSEAALHVLPGDSFLLCSDGLNKTADDSELRDVLSHSDPYAVVRSLVHLGLTRGAPDNITALVVRAF
ncbi:Serine/threonine phosphatase stp [Pseudomonas aeruginosa]|nr:Serine/threonine phosphatase stp [Pseudomonas aeruginosa]